MRGLSVKSLGVNALTLSRVPLIFAYLALAVIGQLVSRESYSASLGSALAACLFAAAAVNLQKSRALQTHVAGLQ